MRSDFDSNIEAPARHSVTKASEILPLDEILDDWKELIAGDYQGYRNHTYRESVIAGAFHGIGIWIDDTLDSIPPSLAAARAHLKTGGLRWFMKHPLEPAPTLKW